MTRVITKWLLNNLKLNGCKVSFKWQKPIDKVLTGITLFVEISNSRCKFVLNRLDHTPSDSLQRVLPSEVALYPKLKWGSGFFFFFFFWLFSQIAELAVVNQLWKFWYLFSCSLFFVFLGYFGKFEWFMWTVI